MRTLRQVFDRFPESRERGLDPAAVERSRAEHGVNRLTPLPREPLWLKFIEKFDDSIIKILLAAALLSMVVDLFRMEGNGPAVGGISFAIVLLVLVGSWLVGLGRWVPTLMFASALGLMLTGLAFGHPLYEGFAVMIAVILATGVAFASEYKSDREFEVLNAQKESLRVKVMRAGEVRLIPSEDVVVGDLVFLEMGDEVPADGRLVKANELLLDQSLMTGESEPVRKLARPEDVTESGPDQPGCLYRGTQVVDGTARMVVVEVGDTTLIGQIARRLGERNVTVEQAEEQPPEDETRADTAEGRVQQKLTISKALTPLQQKLEKLAGLISTVGYVAAGAIFLALIGLALYEGNLRWPAGDEGMLGPVMLGNAKVILDAFVYMVIIIVVAVPEGLPMSVTVSLALAMQKMTRANSLVRQLVACETIGSATVICSDKTGTLTQNKMRTERIVVDGEKYQRGGRWPEPGDADGPVGRLALISAVNSTANLEEKNGRLITVGNTTEGALLQWLRETGADYQKLRDSYPVLYQMHFSSERKRMTTVTEVNGRPLVMLKGAPEVLMDLCDRYMTADGGAAPFTPQARDRFTGLLRESAGDAMRTLAFAYAELPEDFPRDEDAIHDRREEVEAALVFVGFVAIRDPLRDDVREAIDRCREAGIEVKMVTGDNAETARAIGREVGLLDDPDAVVLTSAEFNALSDADLKAGMAKLKILARALPQDKHRLVGLLQEQNEVVAVTGDGTNDAPALKKADVGLAMGIAGTEVAKEASKIVLLDDAFSTIVKAVHWGRSLYENIQRFIQFQLTINVSALTIAFLGPFFGVPPPFTVLQLLWINVIMDTFAAIALCSEPPRSGLMRQPPKRRDENILSPVMRGNILITAAFFVVVMFALLLGMKYDGWFAEGGSGRVSEVFAPLTVRQVSIFFSVYVFFQVWNAINCRSLSPRTSGLHRIWANRTFLFIMTTIVVVQVAITNVPFLAEVFKVEPLGLVDWLAIAAATSSVLVFAEITRRLRV